MYLNHTLERSPPWSIRRVPGFTLIELLITIVILAVILGLAAPSFQQQLTQSRVTNAANEILYMLQYARSEGLKRNLAVTFCPSNDQATCSGNWGDGSIVRRADTNEVLRVGGRPHVSLTITGPAQALTYISAGYLQADPGANFTLSAGGVTRRVCVSPIGLSRVTEESC